MLCLESKTGPIKYPVGVFGYFDYYFFLIFLSNCVLIRTGNAAGCRTPNGGGGADRFAIAVDQRIVSKPTRIRFTIKFFFFFRTKVVRNDLRSLVRSIVVAFRTPRAEK